MTTERWTVQRLIDWTKGYLGERGIDSARLDAELLLAHALKMDRVRLYMEYDRPLIEDELATYRAFVKRRAQHEPVAYITGERAFWTIELKCDKRALIPRPETEVVLESALKRIPEDSAPRVIDIGTGTGALGLSFASERTEAEVILSDVSAGALALATENAESLGIDVSFAESDLLNGIDGDFDLILSNPPYVGRSELDVMGAGVREFEPEIALFAGDDGLDLIRRLIPEAFERLRPNGWLVFEFGYRQGDEIRGLLEAAGYQNVEIIQDYSGNDRVGIGQRP